MKAKEIMTKDVVAVKSTDSVGYTLEKMREHNINGTPVVDDEDHLIGMLVKADIFRFLIAPGHIDESPVDWVMTKELISCNEEDSVIDVTKIIRKNKITSVPIESQGKLVGIVSFEDIIDCFIDEIGQKRT